MIEFLYSIDVSIFFFINHTIANPIFDLVMPFLTDLNKQKIVVYGLIGILLRFLIVGDDNERTMTLMLIITIIISDQLSSSILKPLIGRIRPCFILDGVRLLVDAGPGFSFPSSHAVNNFAAATTISYYFPKQKFGWFIFAAIIAFSRPYVGVHYPSDVIGGAVIGFLISKFCIVSWKTMKKNFISKNKLTNLV